MSHPSIDHQITFLATRDLMQTREFYSHVLGLRETRDQGSCLIFQVAVGAYIGFGQRDEVPETGRGLIFTLVVEDVDSWHELLLEHNVTIEEAPSRNSQYNIYHLFFRDPNGYLIEIQRFLTPAEGNPVVISDYDDSWPAQFEEEKELLEGAIGEIVTSIEHIGSTSIPGLAAKPVIDLMVGVRTLDDAEECIAPIEKLGYIYVPEFEGTMPERRYFRRTAANGSTTHQLHMVTEPGAFWQRHIEFCDYLRAHPKVSVEYSKLKRTLAESFGTDRHGYTIAKGDFIRRVERKAQQWARKKGS